MAGESKSPVDVDPSKSTILVVDDNSQNLDNSIDSRVGFDMKADLSYAQSNGKQQSQTQHQCRR